MSSAKKITLMHFSAAPIVGGVEHVMQQHAQLMAAAGHPVKIIAGVGEQVDPDIDFVKLELAYSKHPDILQIKSELDQNVVSDLFNNVRDQLYLDLCAELSGTDIIIAHNICSLIKNLALTAALQKYVQEHPEVLLISWQHDLAFAADRYKDELHDGYPWNLVSTRWTDCKQRFVAVSEKTQNEVASVFNLTNSEIEVISSGVDELPFLEVSQETVELLNICAISPLHTVYLLPVRITRRKNIEFALKIFAELLKLNKNAALLVTGPPGAHNATNDVYYQELLAKRKELGIEPDENGNGVHFLYEHSNGFLSDRVISDLYRSSDALLMTSVDEGLGIPVIEAGYAKLPVFCSDIPTFHEIAGEIPTFFSLSDDPAQISKRIHDTMEADSSHKLKERVRKKFSWSQIFSTQIQPLLET